MKLSGRWRILISGDGESLSLFPWRRKGMGYLLTRLFSGEEIADGALDNYGIKVRELAEDDEIIIVPPEGRAR